MYDPTRGSEGGRCSRSAGGPGVAVGGDLRLYGVRTPLDAARYSGLRRFAGKYRRCAEHGAERMVVVRMFAGRAAGDFEVRAARLGGRAVDQRDSVAHEQHDGRGQQCRTLAQARYETIAEPLEQRTVPDREKRCETYTMGNRRVPRQSTTGIDRLWLRLDRSFAAQPACRAPSGVCQSTRRARTARREPATNSPAVRPIHTPTGPRSNTKPSTSATGTPIPQ